MKIKINGTYIKFFDEVNIALNLDTVGSVFSFVGRLNPDNPLHKKVFKPLSFAAVEVFSDDDALILTGQIVNHTFNSTSSPGLWNLSGYSTPGILEDVSIPYSLYPLESINRNLKDITERLIAPFGIKLIIDSSVSKDAGLVFDKSVATPSESIKNYLAKIASQRNIVMSHNASGDLVYFRPDTNQVPKRRFNETMGVEMSLGVKGQGLHSEITVLRQPSDEGSNISPVDTIKNALVPGFRPSVQVLSSGTDTATKSAADNELASELKNIEISLTLHKIENLLPGDIIEVRNPEIFLFEYTRLMITGVVITENTKSSAMSISLALPESFTGEQPKDIFK